MVHYSSGNRERLAVTGVYLKLSTRLIGVVVNFIRAHPFCTCSALLSEIQKNLQRPWTTDRVTLPLYLMTNEDLMSSHRSYNQHCNMESGWNQSFLDEYVHAYDTSDDSDAESDMIPLQKRRLNLLPIKHDVTATRGHLQIF